ncbi:YsnF/AvaK domain-containing protein [Isosphaeraceae bacterium EP7]
MGRLNPGLVLGEDGLRGRVEPWADGNAGGTSEAGSAMVLLDDGRRLSVPISLLKDRGDGSFQLLLGAAELGLLRGPAGGENDDEIVIPIVAEQAEVSKRTVEAGTVRISKTVRVHDETVNVPLISEQLDVERVAVNRRVDSTPATRQEGDVTIIPVMEEVLVVEKRLMLKEELRITRRRVEQSKAETVTLRTEVVEVERIGKGAQVN